MAAVVSELAKNLEVDPPNRTRTSTVAGYDHVERKVFYCGPGAFARKPVALHHRRRGLVDAIRARALESPMEVTVRSSIGGRPLPPLESAVYFAVSELLANIAKHAEATEIKIDVTYDSGALRVAVTDNGHGGADPDRGSGLRGVERRLAAFDGVLLVHSPEGGPTTVSVSVPCLLTSDGSN